MPRCPDSGVSNGTSLLTRVQSVFGVPPGHLLPFFCPRTPSGHQVTLSLYVSLGSSGPWQFLRLSCSWWPLQFCQALARCFVDCPSVGICRVFPYSEAGVKAHWEDCRGTVPFLTHAKDRSSHTTHHCRLTPGWWPVHQLRPPQSGSRPLPFPAPHGRISLSPATVRGGLLEGGAVSINDLNSSGVLPILSRSFIQWGLMGIYTLNYKV